MRVSTSTWRVVVFSSLGVLLAGTLQAKAQGLGSRGSLGGYGGSVSPLSSNMGMSGPIIPYSGFFGGFMPSRMGENGGLSFQPRGGSTMGSMRSSFNLSTMSRGMSTMGGGMSRSPAIMGSSTFGSMGGMSGPRGTGVMPPSFSSPFRPPTNLFAPTNGGTGMSM